jgi:hypothetical protein
MFVPHAIKPGLTIQYNALKISGCLEISFTDAEQNIYLPMVLSGYVEHALIVSDMARSLACQLLTNANSLENQKN